MKLPLFTLLLFLATSLCLRAQTVATTANVLHPLKKLGPNGLSSVNQDPSMAREYRNAPPPTRQLYYPPASRPAAAAEPTVIVAKVDAELAASKISLIGTINGLKGTLYVTNLGSQVVTPQVQLALCNVKGLKIGSTSKNGEPLAPNDSEKIEVLATNLTAVDLKLMKLTAVH
jgi:hypothetical protein